MSWLTPNLACGFSWRSRCRPCLCYFEGEVTPRPRHCCERAGDTRSCTRTDDGCCLAPSTMTPVSAVLAPAPASTLLAWLGDSPATTPRGASASVRPRAAAGCRRRRRTGRGSKDAGHASLHPASSGSAQLLPVGGCHRLQERELQLGLVGAGAGAGTTTELAGAAQRVRRESEMEDRVDLARNKRADVSMLVGALLYLIAVVVDAGRVGRPLDSRVHGR